MEVDETYQKMLEKLREHCEREKMSIYALAKNTNLSTSSLSNLLNGKTKPYVYIEFVFNINNNYWSRMPV